MERQSQNIAVVIIGRNEGERLVRCINSVLAQDVLAVYVDSASNDSSIANAQKAGIDFIELDATVPLSAARARNAGYDWLKKSQGSVRYVHFIDGDCELDPGWLDKAVKCLDEDLTIGALCGRLREKDRDRNIFSRLSDMGWYIPPGEIEVCGGIVTIRSDIFEKLAGFDANLIAGEEPEFYLRLRSEGYRILCLDEEMGFHDSDIDSYYQWFTRSSRTGFAYANAKEWGYWQKERRSLIIWGGLLPLIFLASLFPVPLLSVAIVLLYIFQVFRSYKSLNIPYGRGDRLTLASFFIIDKFSEFFGYLKYNWAKWCKKNQTIIEYKK